MNNNKNVRTYHIFANNRGITLVALVITIIILLILAIVAINSIKENNIIKYAQNVKVDYLDSQSSEEDTLTKYEIILAQEAGTIWKQEKNKIVKKDKTLEVGQTVKNFNAGGYTWKLLGERDGKLILTTTEDISNIELRGSTAGWSNNRFEVAEKILNDECKSKINFSEDEKKYVVEIRSINVEDINMVTGYYPQKTGDGYPANYENLWQYENEMTYSIDENGNITYSSKLGSGTSEYNIFKLPTGEDLKKQYKLKSSSYSYYPYSLTDSNLTTGKCNGISIDSDAYTLLFKSDKENYNSYWLASSCVATGDGLVNFGVRSIRDGAIKNAKLWSSKDGDDAKTNGVRPVVVTTTDFIPVV